MTSQPERPTDTPDVVRDGAGIRISSDPEELRAINRLKGRGVLTEIEDRLGPPDGHRYFVIAKSARTSHDVVSDLRQLIETERLKGSDPERNTRAASAGAGAAAPAHARDAAVARVRTLQQRLRAGRSALPRGL